MHEGEMQQLSHNATWTLVQAPPHTNIVGCKWVLKLKAMPDGSVKYKARLVAQGFTQREGVDFDETYSPVVRYTSLRALFALAAHHNWEVHHMDVKSRLPERCAGRDHLHATARRLRGEGQGAARLSAQGRGCTDSSRPVAAGIRLSTPHCTNSVSRHWTRTAACTSTARTVR